MVSKRKATVVYDNEEVDNITVSSAISYQRLSDLPHQPRKWMFSEFENDLKVTNEKLLKKDKKGFNRPPSPKKPKISSVILRPEEFNPKEKERDIINQPRVTEIEHEVLYNNQTVSKKRHRGKQDRFSGSDNESDHYEHTYQEKDRELKSDNEEDIICDILYEGLDTLKSNDSEKEPLLLNTPNSASINRDSSTFKEIFICSNGHGEWEPESINEFEEIDTEHIFKDKVSAIKHLNQCSKKLKSMSGDEEQYKEFIKAGVCDLKIMLILNN